MDRLWQIQKYFPIYDSKLKFFETCFILQSSKYFRSISLLSSHHQLQVAQKESPIPSQSLDPSSTFPPLHSLQEPLFCLQTLILTLAMSKAWAGVGAWALDAEAEEEEQQQREQQQQLSSPSHPPQSFPSLKEAATTKPKKKKPVRIPLNQFVADPTTDELLRLPTAPRERSSEELEFTGRRGFSSSSFGGGGGGGPRRGGGGFDDDARRGPPRARDSDIDLPSRADEVDNWAAGKKQFLPAMDRGRPQDRYGSLGGGSRADEVDNWGAGKRPVQSFGSGFRSSFGSGGGYSDSDRWSRGVSGGGLSSSDGERKRLVLEPPKKDGGVGTESVKSQSRPSPFGAARPREEVLAEKGLDWKKIDLEIKVQKTSRPTSSQSSRPSSVQSSRAGSPGEQMVDGSKARMKVNPFGDAKPREVLLQAQGKDWRKIDLELEHRGIGRCILSK